eukprot:TRINITY_DN5323_c0_g1_i1.p1 TRINITY_DN5323_c0_g1~~TRINITY_DN5323_c0_g1_i1.p1  ORF type:complete len:158 (-),score=18.16 TRINITY_DN5323_c0_g1_i1:92-565(-)
MANIIERYINDEHPLISQCYYQHSKFKHVPKAARHKHSAGFGYIQLLLDSVFVLSPVGNHAECYRLYEALESGSIPIVEDLETNADGRSIKGLEPLKIMNPPWIWIRNWNDLPALMANVTRTPETLLEKQREVFLWWKKFKSSFMHHLKDLLMETIS